MRPRSNPFAAHLTPEAERLLGLVLNRQDRCCLVGFLGHACGRGRPMDELNEADLAAYEAALTAVGNARPKQAARDAAHAWNRMTARAGWPSQRIEPKSNVRHTVLRFEELPKRLQDDALEWLNRQSGEDVFGEESVEAVSPTTLKDRRGKVCQLVSIAVSDGVSLAGIRSLKDLVKEPTARFILQTLWERSGKERNAHAANLARMLRLIAKHYAGAPESVLQLIGKAESKLRPGKTGMTERNKKKLRKIIDDPQALRRLIQLPLPV